MKIYTGFGDKGKTKLYGGQVVSKDHPRVEAYGTFDELNSWLGLIITEEKDSTIKNKLMKIQNNIFNISSEIAAPSVKNRKKLFKNVKETDYCLLEEFIDILEQKLEPLQNFILPGGTKLASYYHVARTICRRAERKLVKLFKSEEIEEEILIYTNRLSDLLFVLARFTNKCESEDDVIWQGH